MWRCHGIPIVVFLDDGFGGGATELTAKIHSLKVHTDLTQGEKDNLMDLIHRLIAS